VRTCRNCSAALYAGPNPYQIDELVCRACQRSPAVQMRVLLMRARERGMTFDAAYSFAFARIRWPHDTSHRREWKVVLADPAGVQTWREAYERTPLPKDRAAIANLAMVA
jgi:hypothetical protein